MERNVEPGARAAGLALRVGIVAQSAALAWLAFGHGTAVDSFLFIEHETSEATAALVDRLLAGVAGVASLLLLVRASGAVALAVSAVFLVQALAVLLAGGYPFAELSPAAHATRWLAPAAILALGARRRAAAGWILRVAIAATFLTHGWEALRHHPAFVDLLLGTVERWSGAAIRESSARLVLDAIGIVDVAVAVLLLTRRWRLLALWATLWGLATAASRPVALGPEFLHESLLRTMNAATPLALWFLWSPSRSDDSPSPS